MGYPVTILPVDLFDGLNVVLKAVPGIDTDRFDQVVHNRIHLTATMDRNGLPCR